MKRLIFIFSIALAFSIAIYSQTPHTISFQGAATDIAGSNLPDGDYMMIFKIYKTETGGSSMWSETQNVHVSGGIFNVVLGSVSPLDILFDQQYWLGVKIENDPEMTPRIQFTASPYAFIASTVEDGAITTDKILDGAVTQDKLEPGLSLPPGGTAGGDLTGNFPNPTIANNAVTTDKLADGAVTQNKLDAGVTAIPSGVAGGDLTGNYPNPTIKSSAVTSDKILDDEIMNDDINWNAAIEVSKLFGDVGLEFVSLDSHIDIETSIISLGSVTVSTPTDGYLIVLLTGSALFSGDNTILTVGLSSTGTSYNLSHASTSLGKFSDLGSMEFYQMPYNVMWAGAVNASSITVHAIANKNTMHDANQINIAKGRLTAIFIPKKY